MHRDKIVRAGRVSPGNPREFSALRQIVAATTYKITADSLGVSESAVAKAMESERVTAPMRERLRVAGAIRS